MAYNPKPTDFEIITNHIHHTLCTLDQGDRALGTKPKWHDLTELVKQINAYSNKKRVRSQADYILNYRLQFMERKKETFDVRLTKKEREYCGKRIRIKSI
jgi:hypothetical protein